MQVIVSKLVHYLHGRQTVSKMLIAKSGYQQKYRYYKWNVVSNKQKHPNCKINKTALEVSRDFATFDCFNMGNCLALVFLLSEQIAVFLHQGKVPIRTKFISILRAIEPFHIDCETRIGNLYLKYSSPYLAWAKNPSFLTTDPLAQTYSTSTHHLLILNSKLPFDMQYKQYNIHNDICNIAYVYFCHDKIHHV